MSSPYAAESVTRDQVDVRPGALVIQFGTNWCGWCRATDPDIERVFSTRPEIERLKVEDGSGRPLGRSFRVKLWPTLVFLKDGHEVARITRPQSAEVIAEALARV